jgi:protein TonB
MSAGRGIHPAAWAVALLLHGAAGAVLLAAPPAPRLEAGGGLVVGLAFGDGGAETADPPGEADVAAPLIMVAVPAPPRALPAPAVPDPVAVPILDAMPPPAAVPAPLPPAVPLREAAPAPAADAALVAEPAPAATPETPRADPDPAREAAPLPAPPPPMRAAAPGHAPAAPSPRAAARPAAQAASPQGQTGASPPGGGPAQGPGPDAVTTLPPGYVAALRRILEHNLRFPMAAREQGLSGTATVRFSLARDGRVLGAALARSSGQPSLDREAVALLGRVSPLPPLPPEFPGAVAELVVPVVFVLR